MRFALDISQIIYGTGVSTYTKELISGLSTIDSVNEYVLFAGAWKQTDTIVRLVSELNLGPNFRLKTFSLPPRAQTFLWNYLHIGALEYYIGQFDLYHSLDWSLAPTSTASLITVHDLFFLKRPDLQQHPYRTSLHRRLLLAKRARLPAIAVSQATKQDLIDVIQYPAELITVIYEAARPTSHIAFTSKQQQALKKQLGINGDYLLMVGTQEPRKNYDRTIAAFTSLNLPNLSLVIVGKTGWGNQSTSNANVIFTGYLSDTDVYMLWSGAHGFLYPSLYEGFGIPILQSFAVNVPVLTSDISSMPEVGGHAAIYVDPFSDQSLRQGIKQLATLSATDRKHYTHLGQQQLAKFSWNSTAQQTLNLYQKILNDL